MVLFMTNKIPATRFPGAIPTLNGRGFMLEALDSFADDFIAFASQEEGEVLDIGCAYGVASLAALNAGARVCACDMEPRHLGMLVDQTPPALKSKLRTVTGVLPEVKFPAQSFRARSALVLPVTNPNLDIYPWRLWTRTLATRAFGGTVALGVR
jgi:SAM-dependent methyltransferase